MFKNIYKNKKVLVTGHTGFKGTWLTLWLIMMGADVVGVSKDIPTKPSMFEDLKLISKVKHVIMDIRNCERLLEVFKQEKPDIVFHMAAQPIVKTSYSNPHDTFTTNVVGTLNVLESIRVIKSVQAAVIITSDKAYKNKEWAWGYREDDQLGGEDPYSGSKGSAELVAYSYIESYFKSENTTNVAVARAGNVIGGGDWADFRIVPDCIRAWQKNEKVILRNPHSTRPWQHVLEPLSGYLQLGASLLLCDTKAISEAFNFGPDATVNHPVVDLINSMNRVWQGPGFDIITQENVAQPEAGLLKLCCDKALHNLAWQPTLQFSETVSFTAKWYLHHQSSHENCLQFTKDQINQYIQLAEYRNVTWARVVTSKRESTINTLDKTLV